MSRIGFPRPNRRRLFLMVFGLLLGGTLLVGTEIALKRAGFPDNSANPVPEYSTTRGYRLSPNEYRHFDGWNTEYTLNELGLRDRPLDAKRKPGEYRIFCMGNSCVFGTGGWISDSEPYPQQLAIDLQSRLPDYSVRVLNAGIPGYSSRQGIALYHEVLRPYRPDLVIIAYAWNDHWRDRFTEETQERLRRVSEKLNRSVLLSTLYRRVEGDTAFFQLMDSLLLSVIPQTIVARVPLPDFKRNLGALIDQVRADGAEALLLTLPTDSNLARPGVGWFEGEPFEAYLEHPLYNDAIRAVANEKKALLFDAAANIERRLPAEQLFLDFVHYNQRGHRLMARELAGAIEQCGFPGLSPARDTPTVTARAETGY